MTVWTDREMLEVMDRFERQRQTGEYIGQAFGVSRSAIMGLVHRVRHDLAQAGESTAVRPANMDGGMSARWWAYRPGPARRGR